MHDQLPIILSGWTALHEACNFGRVDVAKCLLKAGANVNVQGLDNDLPLHDAARNGHVKVNRLKSLWSFKILTFGRPACSLQIVRLLLRHGADPLLQNLKGKSSLDVATGDEIIKLMRSEVMASSSGCSSTSPMDVRSPASLESCPPEQDEDPTQNKRGKIREHRNKKLERLHFPAHCRDWFHDGLQTSTSWLNGKSLGQNLRSLATRKSFLYARHLLEPPGVRAGRAEGFRAVGSRPASGSFSLERTFESTGQLQENL